MSPQADYVVANGTGAAVRSDINGQLAAIVSNNSGATEPATMYAYQWWADTTTGLLKIRNAANNGWITLRRLDGAYTDITLNAQADLRFADSDSSNWVAFQGPATIASNVTWTLPSTDGTNGQALITNGSGTLSWGAGSQWTTSGSDIYYTTGKVLVGTSTARDKFFASTFAPAVQIEGSTTSTSAISTCRNSNDDNQSYVILSKSRSSSYGVVSSGDSIGEISFQAADGTNFIRAAQITAVVDGTPGTNDMPGRLIFATTADGASSPTERMRIASSGLVSTESNLQCKGRLYWSSGADGSSLSTSSIGAGTTTVYIGNAAIQVSSDVRLKENIANTVVDAAEELKKVRVVDFTWNDPTDSSFNNRNARGVWTGLIAQELVEVFPFAVNAPRKEEDLSIDYDDEAIWTVDQNQLVPVLIKAFQQQQERIETLEAKVAALEAS